MNRGVALVVVALAATLAGACSPESSVSTSGRLADEAATNLAQLTTEARAKLAELAAVPEVRDGDAATCHTSVRTRVPPLGIYTAFGRADANGNLYCISTPDTTPIDISDRAYFQRAMASGDFAVGDYHIGRATFMESIGVGYPVMKDGRLDGIVLAPLDLDKLAELMSEINAPAGAELVVIDAIGTVLVHQPDPQRWTGTRAAEIPLVAQMLAAETGDGSLAGVDGTTRTYSWRTVEGSAGNLRLAVGVPG